jgi:hypothetical protein
MPRGAGNIKMSLSSLSPTHSYINSIMSSKPINNNQLISSLKKQGTSLKSPMISRVNGVNASCGSCGRK